MKTAYGAALILWLVPQLATARPVDHPRWLNEAMLTIGLPLYVRHPDGRLNGKHWNQGWLKNEGMIGDITWPVYALTSNLSLRVGGAAGAFHNSIFRLSTFVTFVGEVDMSITPSWRTNFGTYAGAITGYEQTVRPALTPYAGTAFALSNGWQLGGRVFWLPARTLAGSEFADSDAYVGALTLSYIF